MSEPVRISEELRAFLEARQRDDETVEETLERVVETRQANATEAEHDDLTGPHPEEVAGIISSETAEKMRERIERGAERDATARQGLRERLE